MTQQELHATIADGIELGRIIAIKQNGAVKLYTPKHIEDGNLDKAQLVHAITAQEYRQLAEQDMTAPSN